MKRPFLGYILTVLLFIIPSRAFPQNIDTAFKYLDSGMYDRAAAEFRNIIPLLEKAYGPTDTSTFTFYLMMAGTSCEKAGDYTEAEKYYIRTKEIFEQVNGRSNPMYINSLSRLADLYYTTGEFSEARKQYLQITDLLKNSGSENSLNYINALNSLALVTEAMGDYMTADSVFNKSLEACKAMFGDEHPRYAIILGNIAALYQREGNYEKAGSLYRKVLEINLKAYGYEHPSTVSTLNNLGAFYDDLGDYAKAESYYNRALEIRKKIIGDDNTGYALSENNLAELYYKTGNFEKAQSLYLHALDIYRKTYGEDHYMSASVLNNLGALYNASGDYADAESCFLSAMNIRKKVFGENHPDYATSLNNLALLYYDLGDPDKAERMLLQALSIRRQVLGENHPLCASTLNNLSLVCSEKKEFDTAENYLQEALKITAEAMGKQHPSYAAALNNLALFYSDLGENEKAETLFDESLGLYRRNPGEKHPEYASCLNNLAGIYAANGQFRKAESAYRESAEIIRESAGLNHPDYASVLNNLSLLYFSKGIYRKTAPLFSESGNIYYSQIRQQFSFQSEQEKQKYLDRIEFFFRTYQNFIIKYFNKDPELPGIAYDIEIRWKGLLLSSETQVRKSILSGGDTSAIRIYETWTALRASLAKLYSQSESQRSLEIQSLEENAADLERKLARLSSGKRAGFLQDISWKDVQKSLKENDAAIEFTNFPVFNGSDWSDSVIYAAVILRKNDTSPHLVPLFEIRKLDTLLKKGAETEENFINKLYSWYDKENITSSGQGRKLYEIIWKPLEKYLEGCTDIFYSPSGRLHQVSFSAIPCTEIRLLSDKYNLHQVNSTAILTRPSEELHPNSMVIFGGIEYDEAQEKMEKTAGKYRMPGPDTIRRSGYGFSKTSRQMGPFAFLFGTIGEAENIRRIAAARGINPVIIKGDEAVEESFKNLNGNSSPEVIHIATHGFFFNDAKTRLKNTATHSSERGTGSSMISDNPLMRSGLVFAGANHAWLGKEIPAGIDDGILTSYEVSNMYLPGTRLVVLSACETGLGEIRGSEGVFGLQRSFRIAGAEKLMMSLWQIPDYQTAELMSQFYLGWLSGMAEREAFDAAQDFMKKKYPGEPYMWAAFILVQ